MTELLFSYGTLQLADVQRAVFGSLVAGEADAIVGFELRELVITDPAVIATSGTDIHPVLLPSADPHAAIEGTVFTINAAQLAAADDYEVDAYRRRALPLRSGRKAWVYVLADETAPGTDR